MLERALMHVRAAMILRDCAARAGSDGERRLLIGMASIHEARARRAIGWGRRPGGHGPGQARR